MYMKIVHLTDTVYVLVNNSVKFLSMIVPFLQLPSVTMSVSIATGTTNTLNCYKLSGFKDFVHTS